MFKRQLAGLRLPGAGLVVSAAAVLAVLAVRPAQAQDAGPVTVDLGACVDIESAEERFACYEARVDEATGGAARPARPAPAPGGGGAETSPPAAAPAEQQATPARQAASAPESSTDEVFGTIAALRETVPDSYLITLADGQVWRQTSPKRYYMRVGDEVRIYPSDWGASDRLSVMNQSGWIQVERVR